MVSTSSDLPTIRTQSGTLVGGQFFMPAGAVRQPGNYRLLHLIAGGGFADVYPGVHIHLNTYAAIKVLRARLPGLPAGLEAVVMRALSKNPADRYPSMRDLAAQFEAALSTLHPLQMNLVEEAPPTRVLERASPYAPTIAANPRVIPAPPVPPRRGPTITLRAALLGISGVAVLGLSGGTLAWLVSKSRHIQSPPPSPTVMATPTPIPIGTTFHTYRGHHDSVLGVASALDGSYIASASKDTTVQVWDTATGGVNAVAYAGHTAAVNSVAWSPDGTLIASSGADKTAQVWGAADGSHAFTYKGHGAAVNAVACIPNPGQAVASASLDTTVQIWQGE